MEIMYSNSVSNSYFPTKNFVGFIGDIKDAAMLINDLNKYSLNPKKKVKKYIKDLEAFKSLGLSSDILKKKIKDLSNSEYKLILLIKTCETGSKVIILNNFDLGFNYKAKSKISKYIKTINAINNTNFIIISNDIFFINKNAKHIIVTKNKIIKYQGDLITAIKQGLIEEPPILNFINMANDRNANLDYTLDNKELLKNIYRSVF